jgi:hypothetical protein
MDSDLSHDIQIRLAQESPKIVGPAHPLSLRGSPPPHSMRPGNARCRIHHAGAGSPQDPESRRPKFLPVGASRSSTTALQRILTRPVFKLRSQGRRTQSQTIRYHARWRHAVLPAEFGAAADVDAIYRWKKSREEVSVASRYRAAS